METLPIVVGDQVQVLNGEFAGFGGGVVRIIPERTRPIDVVFWREWPAVHGPSPPIEAFSLGDLEVIRETAF